MVREIRDEINTLRGQFERHHPDDHLTVHTLHKLLKVLEKIMDALEAFTELQNDTAALLTDISEKLAELLALVKPPEGASPATAAIEALDDSVKTGITAVQGATPEQPKPEESQAEKEAKETAEREAQEAKEKEEQEAREKAEKEAAGEGGTPGTSGI